MAPVVHEVVPFLQMLGLVVQAEPVVQAMQPPEPLQTWLVPQVVPAALLPLSMQVMAPVVHEVAPVRQTPGLVVQAEPDVHATQVPEPLQTMLVPHDTPGDRLVSSTQVCAPVEQDVRPFRQGFGFMVQADPALQATQLPEALQTKLLPQPVPAAFMVPFTHVELPLEHDAVPLKQGLGLPAQLCPCVQVPQNPLPSQTWLEPQAVPAMTLPVPSTQDAVPVAQEMTPLLHDDGLPLHAPPAAHATHMPVPLQTRLVPQPVPAAFAVPSTHVWTPVVHAVTPLTHAPPGFVVHAWPAVQSVHWPLALHTWLVPQVVPGDLAAPSIQVCTPVAHDVTPLAHAPGLPVHACPSAQATHAPLPSHTIPAPQAAPAARLAKSRQTDAPVVQLVTPVLHGDGLVVQLALAVQATQLPALLQTMLVPQLMPVGWLASSAQVRAPVAHEVTPVLHAPGLVEHACPPAHATHAPAVLQTMPTPQLVPAARFAPSTQVVAPLPEQLVTPCLHAVGLPVQVWLATQAPQKPLPSHSWPPVQVVVFGLGVPSMQVDAPVTHEVTPLRQIDGLVVHAVPAVQETQVPVPLHTWLVPQVVPAGVVPESTHFGAPPAQSITPVLQGAPGFVVQVLPASHVTHCPLPLQTMFEPQAVPAPALSPSAQPAADPQVTTPSLQTPPGLVVQMVPAAQVVQAPALQTFSVPQNVPSGALMSSLHWGAPVLQVIAPFRHGLPAFVEQVAPVAQGIQVPAALHT
jgi:hypothetical protein